MDTGMVDAIAGIGIIPLIVGLVQVAKALGIPRRWQPATLPPRVRFGQWSSCRTRQRPSRRRGFLWEAGWLGSRCCVAG